ncbi:MAG TPA: zf-TFIIB domain-containing protein [Terriglobales bacterium]|nr:zf-TFIIB domain-containing protein [Terriglobales bacterium]
MLCLNCGTEMTNNRVSTAHDQIAYDMCEHCGSLWLDAGELDKMAFRVKGSIEASTQEPMAEPETDLKRCPRCDNAHLYRVRFLEVTDIVLRRCRSCHGFWLDGGQLDLLDKELKADMPVRGRGFADFVHNVHVPYWFQRVQRKSSELEARREAPPLPGALRVGAADAVCPACGLPLAAYRAFGVDFEGCPACKGVFLFPDELRRLKDKVEDGEVRWLNEEIDNLEKASAIETKRLCPRCKDVRLIAAILGKSSIAMDWCPRCHGIWLDQEEFAEMVEYLKREMGALRPEEMRARALQELKAVWSGGAEGRLEELLDAKATLGVLINATILQHPALAAICLGAPRL